jgi:uncharacterized membrane protein HdeD (DUF308 family)
MSAYTWIRDPIAAGLDEIHYTWGWVLALGMGLVITGAICILAASTATLVTVLVFGWLLLIGAAISLVHAFQSRTSGSFFLHLMSVLLRGVTGFLLVRYPSAGAVSLTLVLASFFIVGGVFRAVGCAALQVPRWGWGALSGIISVALGIVMLLQLPTLSIWFIGLAIGVDMIFDGVGLAAMGLALHHLPGGRKLTGG